MQKVRSKSTFVMACAAAIAAALTSTTIRASVVVDDSWADGGRSNGADPLDSNWWTSASTAGIEVSVGSLGMVTGTSGRGIHTVFPTQSLAIGDALLATYTFTTPATIGTGATGGFRVGLFDTLGRAGLDADITASSGSPNSLYGYFGTSTPGLPGYMMDMDMGTGAEDLAFRRHETVITATTPTGRLLGTSTGFTSLSPTGPDGAYTWAPNTTYVGTMQMKRISATEMEVSGSLGSATHSVIDTFISADVGMLAFWANSNIFGSSGAANTPDNGIDFTNVKIEYIPVPEPTCVAALALIALAATRRRAS